MNFQQSIIPCFHRNFLVKIWSYQKHYALFPGMQCRKEGENCLFNYSKYLFLMFRKRRSFKHYIIKWWLITNHCRFFTDFPLVVWDVYLLYSSVNTASMQNFISQPDLEHELWKIQTHRLADRHKIQMNWP